MSATVKALFPIGKTQWAKWNDDQRTAFNEAREAGVPFADAVQASNDMKKGGGILGAIKDVVEVVAAVSGASAAVDVAVSGVKKAVGKKKAS